MCFSSFTKYMLLSVVVGILVIFSIFLESLFYILPLMVIAIMQSRISCPNCDEAILKDKNGWYMFTLRPTCRHCGYDTMICKKKKN